MKTPQLFLKPRMSLTDVDTWKYLIACGFNIHNDEFIAFKYASFKGCVDILMFFKECGLDIIEAFDSDYQAAFRYASKYEQHDVLKFFKDNNLNFNKSYDNFNYQAFELW